MIQGTDPFGARAKLEGAEGNPIYYRLARLSEAGLTTKTSLDQMPITVKILLENVLRYAGSAIADEGDVKRLAAWDPKESSTNAFPFLPARVLLQDYTGVPAVVDFAAMRAA